MGHMIQKKDTKTAVFIQEYKGNEMFSIWEVDNDGSATKEFPIMSFGKTKAAAILRHLSDLKKYLGDESKTVTITKEEYDQLQDIKFRMEGLEK